MNIYTQVKKSTTSLVDARTWYNHFTGKYARPISNDDAVFLYDMVADGKYDADGNKVHSDHAIS
jgi:hypothetical protein